MFYLEENNEKCFKNLNKIHQLTKIENINITINDKKISRKYRVKPYILFYINSMGIMYLKLKKYSAAEFFFKTCIEHYKRIWSTISKLEFDFSIRLTDIYLIKYNLGLCYFYQKKYIEAYKIFKDIIQNNKNFADHFFIWYRTGICLLEIELNELRKLREKNTLSNNISKTYGYNLSINVINTNYSNSNPHSTHKFSTTNSSKNKNKIKSSSNPLNNNNNSPKKGGLNNKEKEEGWDPVKFLNENLKDIVGVTSLDDKVESVVNQVNQINEDIAYNQMINSNRRRIILQNNIFSEFSSSYDNFNNNNYNNCSRNNNLECNDNDNLNTSNSVNNDEGENDANISDFNDTIYHNIININKTLKLSEIIYCFKKVINYFRNMNFKSNNFYNIENNSNNPFNIDTDEFINFFTNKERERENKKNNHINTNAAGDYIDDNQKNNVCFSSKNYVTSKSFNSLINNTYMSLIFTLLLDKNWISALSIIKEYDRIDNFKKDEDTKIKLNNYLVVIYLNINQIDKAIQIIKNDLDNNVIDPRNENSNFYSSSHNKLYVNVPYKMMLFSNLMKMHLINNNISEAEKTLTNLIDNFNLQNVYQIPPFIINQIIYLNLLKGNIDIVLNLVKFRRVNMNSLSPILNSPCNKN